MHQNDTNKLNDCDFYKGEIKFLVKGNKCRYMDGRRTEGYIEDIYYDSGIFRWKITNYEDVGCYWDMDFEDVNSFQFYKSSEILSLDSICKVQEIISKYNKQMTIAINKKALSETQDKIDGITSEIITQLKNIDNYSTIFYINSKNIEFNNEITNLMNDYLDNIGVLHLETLTQKLMVLNPDSGEHIKANMIVMAELGLVNYYGKIIRDKAIFDSDYSKTCRKSYILHRLAFVRAIFKINNIDYVILYRGMSVEGKWTNRNRTLLHMTFSKDVAEEFCDMRIDSKFTTSYMLKIKMSTELLFMTFIETKAMNTKYQEKEAIVIGDVNFIV